MSKPVSIVMDTIALPAMGVSLIIPLLVSYSIEDVRRRSNVHTYLLHVGTMGVYLLHEREKGKHQRVMPHLSKYQLY